MSYERVVCPLSVMTDTFKQCHPACKFNNDKGGCMLVEYLKQQTEKKKD